MCRASGAHDPRYTPTFRFSSGRKRTFRPDVNTNEQTMAWIMDTYSMPHAADVHRVVTASRSPRRIGGGRGHRTRRAHGLRSGDQEAWGLKSQYDAGHRAGFGNVGSNAARLDGAIGDIQVIGIVEVGGGLYKKMHRHGSAVGVPRARGHIHGFPGGREVRSGGTFADRVRHLDSGGTENQITSQNADR